MNTPLLAIGGVSFETRSRHTIIRQISLDVDRSDRLAIIGPNGAGKTTLLQIMSGVISPSNGNVFLAGDDLAGMPPAQRARSIAVVSQSDQPDRRLSLRDYVALGRIPHAGRVARAQDVRLIDDAIGQTGLSDFAAREMGSLSGGERQRAHIARALVQQPKILFLDEPTNHLDPRARGALLGLVAELDLTVVAVLHDLQLVPAFATHVAVLQGGALVAHGTPEQALSPGNVREVFGIELLRLRHPAEDRDITVFDIPFNTDTRATHQ